MYLCIYIYIYIYIQMYVYIYICISVYPVRWLPEGARDKGGLRRGATNPSRFAMISLVSLLVN